jgi:NAD(P)-dependent dehydrogenase (short-subunit alcohol dehydrogenase family)
VTGVEGPILITGCSSGIGRATAEHLARSSRTVYASGRTLESVAPLAASGCRTVQLDVTDEDSIRAAVRQIEAEYGAVGALVNNAGYAVSGAIEAVSLDEVRHEFDTNVFGYVRMAQAVLPAMRARRAGRIINVSSVAGLVTMPGAGAYAASKYAIEAISDALRFELRGFGIDVVVVEPGPIRSAFTATANAALGATIGAGGGPYTAYHKAVAAADAETDDSFIAGRPEQVAKAIERALDARRPRPRYKVTPIARVLPVLRGTLGDRGFDAFLRTQIKAPGG